jgi:hypothetical protein
MMTFFLLGSAFAYTLLISIYRLHIHPLSRFPGPRLAAMTRLYEIYFAVWGDGSFDREIRRLHREYGRKAKPSKNPALFGSAYSRPW